MTTKRTKLLKKIAQATTPDPTVPAVVAPTTIPGSPPSVTIDAYFPTFTAAWGANFKTPADTLLDILNQTIFVLSIGALNLESLRINSFNVDVTKYPDPFLNGVVSFSKLVFTAMLNGGKPFLNKISDKSKIIDDLTSAINTNNKIPDSLNAAFPQLFLQTKIGNFKPKVISILTQMSSLIV